MANSSLTPVVIGVGDVINRSVLVEDSIEPLELMFEAIRQALKDTEITDQNQLDLQSVIDSIEVVSTWTWPYHDLPGLLANKLGAKPRHTATSAHGGNQPAKLFDEAARRISLGQTKVAVVVGGEALASCM